MHNIEKLQIDRVIELRIGESDEWTKLNFSSLRDGDVFRMFELDGTPVKDKNGNTVWRAITDPYVVNHDGKDTLAVQVEL